MKNSFNTDGFLSSDINEYKKEIRNNFSTRLGLAYEANQLAHKIIHSVKIYNEHLPDLLLASLLIRQVSTFQAFLIILESGLKTQAEMLLRNISETMFIAGAINKDGNFADKYVLSEEVSRKKALIRLKNNNERQDKLTDQETLDLIALLEEKIRTEKIKTFSTERIAQIAGLTHYYDIIYPLTSMAVHTSSRGLDKLLITDKTGKVKSIDYIPVVDGYDMHLDYGINMLLYTIHQVASHFKVSTDSIEALQNKISN